MRIAVIGAGVAGLYAAWHLAQQHRVVLFEQHGRAGGHTDTHAITSNGRTLAVDTGFIVFNPERYPLFNAWIDQHGVESRESVMSFGVSCTKSGLEYNATDLDSLFCQRSNLIKPGFLRMLLDLFRFYRQAPGLLRSLDDGTTLGEWLEDAGMCREFSEYHLVPMASALWSTPPGQVSDFPMRYLLEFMQNHQMLQAFNRPIWKTIRGGSRQYVDRVLQSYCGELRVGCRVHQLERHDDHIVLRHEAGEEPFDQAVLACHADQALALMSSPSQAEHQVLSAFEYSDNDTVLHTDRSVMPSNRKAWASWNVRIGSGSGEQQGAISYWMNRLQGIEDPTPYIVSLNQTSQIDPARILKRRQYQHPLYTRKSRQAQTRLAEINGLDRVWFCGAHWGWGFHEDAVRSAGQVLTGLEAYARAA